MTAKGGDDMEPAEPEPVNHRLVDVVVEVEPNRQAQIWPLALSLATMGASPISARSRSTYASRRARSASISWRWSHRRRGLHEPGRGAGAGAGGPAHLDSSGAPSRRRPAQRPSRWRA